jgi:hypothetical protein
MAVLVLKRPVSDRLKLPDGSTVHILGVTFGTNHVVGTPLARLVATIKPPAPIQQFLGRYLGDVAIHRASTPEPTMIIWLDRSTNGLVGGLGGYSCTVMLADTNGFVSGSRSWMSVWQQPAPLYFTAFPRRAPTIDAHVFYYDSTSGGVRHCGSLKFANPLYGTFTQWQPESLPITRRTGDVDVTLEKFSIGHDNRFSQKGLPRGRYVIENFCLIRTKSLGDTNQLWRMVSAELCDATGNKLRSAGTTWGGEEQSYFAFEPGLWLDEKAWKLRCEIKRFTGFAPDEILVFKDVPLGELEVTNRIGWTTNFGGISVAFDYSFRRAPNTNSSWSSDQISNTHFTVNGLTDDVHFDLVSARTDTGADLFSGSSASSGSSREYSFREIPPEARTADFTFAVHRSRWVEFLVKPEIGPGRLEYGTSGRK